MQKKTYTSILLIGVAGSFLLSEEVHFEKTSSISEKNIAIETNEVKASEIESMVVDQLEIKDAILKLNSEVVEEPILAYDGRYFIRFDALSKLENEALSFSVQPYLQSILVNKEDKIFHLPLVQPIDLFMKEGGILKNTPDESFTFFADDSLYLPVDFAVSELEYEVEKSGTKQLVIDVKSNQAELPLDIPLLLQMDAPRLYNGCEVTSLAMILQFHGINVTKNELAENINYVPLTYADGLRGNPNEGFVGDMVDGPGLSVSHGPIMELAKQYVGNNAKDLTGTTPEVLYSYLDKGLPVWIITTASFAPVANFEQWSTPDGVIDVTYSIHSVAVTGYDQDSVYINDPYGGKNKKVNRENFEAAWKQMGSQAVVILN